MPAAHPSLRELKLLELSSGAAGPVAARYFAEQGATVVRVESAKRPDFLRILQLTPDSPHGLDGAPMFILLNPNKESVSVNLKPAAGKQIVERLVAWADVVLENFSPGVMARLGLDYQRLRRVRPDLIMLSGCLFGQTGPQRGYPGFGGQGTAIAGFNHLIGWPDRESYGPYGTLTDSLAPRYAALAVAGALLERRRTGRGQYIDLSQIEAGVYSLSELVVRYAANGEIPSRRGNRSEQAAPHAVVPCAGEDRWIAIAVFDDDSWRALCRVMGDPDWARDPDYATGEGRLRHEPELDRRLAEWTSGVEPYALMAKLQAAGVEAGVVQTLDDLLADPQLAHRGHFEEIEHAHLGRLRFERSGFRLSENPGGLDRPGPNLGEHNQRVLGEYLGLDAVEIAALAELGALE